MSASIFNPTPWSDAGRELHHADIDALLLPQKRAGRAYLAEQSAQQLQSRCGSMLQQPAQNEVKCIGSLINQHVRQVDCSAFRTLIIR
jgi:hypothetical protein